VAAEGNVVPGVPERIVNLALKAVKDGENNDHNKDHETHEQKGEAGSEVEDHGATLSAKIPHGDKKFEEKLMNHFSTGIISEFRGQEICWKI
jgi:hypothetical protein